MNNPLAQKLKLRRDAIFMKTDSGILFRARKGTFALRGNTVYTEFQRLLPFLDGQQTGTEVLDLVGEERRRTVSEMLQALLQRGVVQSADPADAARVDAQTAQVFESQIEFIRHYADKPQERFAAFRETRLLLAGSGSSFASAGTALLRNGLRTLCVSNSSSTRTDAMERECERLWGKQVKSRVVRLDLSAPPGRFDLDMVLYCSEAPNMAEICRLNAQAVTYGFSFLPAYIYAGTTLIGPLVDPRKPGCWECAMLRWTEAEGGDRSSNFWRRVALQQDGESLSRDVSDVASQMLGNMAALEIFKMRAGHPEPEARQKLLKQDLSTMEIGAKTILPHPDCTVCASGARWRLPLPAQGPNTERALSASECLEKMAPAVDKEFGAFLEFDDEDIEQVPLRLSSVRFAVAATEKNPRRTQSALGWSLEDSHGASVHALSSAIHLKLLASLPGSLRRMAIARPRCNEQTVPVNSLLGSFGNWSEGADPELCLEMQDLASGEQALVPAGAVHPDFDLEKWFDAYAAGFGVASGILQAQQKAVLSLYEYRVLAGLAHGTLTAKRFLPDADAESNALTKYLLCVRAQLGIADGGVLVVPTGTGVHVAVIPSTPDGLCRMPDLILASGFSAAEAINAALTESVARAQLAANQPGAERGGHTWQRTALRGGRYAHAQFAPKVKGHISTARLADPVSLNDAVTQAGAQGQRFLWLEVTPPDLQLCGAFRVVKAVMTDGVSQ